MAAIERDWAVQVFERGEVGQNVREWGHVTMFTPFGMNVSARGLDRIGVRIPPDALLTGAEYVAQYLEPLGRSLGGVIYPGTEVVSVARVATLKVEMFGEKARGTKPFRILLRDGKGEWTALADLVLDCTGVWRTPCALGDGGMPAAGERECASFIDYGLPDVLGKRRAVYEGRSVLVVGDGHSASTVVRQLAELACRVVWVTRREIFVRRVAGDSLPGRVRLGDAAEALVRSRRVEHLPEQGVLSVRPQGDRVRVVFTNAHGKEAVEFDRIVACTGFKPDLALTRELQVDWAPSTEGVRRLSDAMDAMRPGQGLELPPGGAALLEHPEPHFFVLGSKSCGRRPGMLVRLGLQQVEQLFAWLSGEGGRV
jgi:hypothetical protein